MKSSCNQMILRGEIIRLCPDQKRSEFILIIFLDHMCLVDEGKVLRPTYKLNAHYERSATRTEGNLQMEQKLLALNPTRRFTACRAAQKNSTLQH